MDVLKKKLLHCGEMPQWQEMKRRCVFLSDTTGMGKVGRGSLFNFIVRAFCMHQVAMDVSRNLATKEQHEAAAVAAIREEKELQRRDLQAEAERRIRAVLGAEVDSCVDHHARCFLL